MNDKHELVWESFTEYPGVQAAVMEPTEDGWHCVAVILEPGAVFESQNPACHCVVTVASGFGILSHSGVTKNYEPKRRYVIGETGSIKFLKIWGETILAITWPPGQQQT